MTRHKRSVDEVKNDSEAIHVSPKHLKTRKEIEINKCTNCLARVVTHTKINDFLHLSLTLKISLVLLLTVSLKAPMVLVRRIWY